MNAVKEAYKLTLKLQQELSQKEHDRDNHIQNIEQLLNDRDIAIKLIRPPFSAEEKELGRAMVKLNDSIGEKLREIRFNISKDIKTLKNRERGQYRYVNPYGTTSHDGTFYDKRK
jgi:flagellar protein FliT